MLEVRADSPPSPVVMLTRMHRLHGLAALHPMWERWEDAAALARSAVAIPMDVQADLVVRSGHLALRRICDFFGIAYEAEPKPTDATSIDRARFDNAFDAATPWWDRPMRSAYVTDEPMVAETEAIEEAGQAAAG